MTTAMRRMSDRMPSLGQHNFLSTNFGAADLTNIDFGNVSRSETIHSGHFMVSEIDDLDNAEEKSQVAHESDYEQPDAVPEEASHAYDLELPVDTTQLYSYGPQSSHIVTIDASLSKLFKCMTLAYSGKLTSPKWKTFKGLKLKLKDKIRLNNIIWRAWHIQYVMSRKPPVCQFASLVDCDSHNKPEAVVLEGKYWKRRLTTVAAEYQKWRVFHKEKTYRRHRFSLAGFGDMRWPDWTTNSYSGPGSLQADDDFVMDFNDTTLFNSLLPPNVIDFPNPREITRSGFGADFIQPGLTQLQPSFDDYMDFDYLFTSRHQSILPTLPEESAVDSSSDTVKVSETTKLSSEDNGDFLSTLETIVDPSTSINLPSTHNPYVVTAPMQEQSSVKMNNELTSEIDLSNTSCQSSFLGNSSEETQSLSAICQISSQNEVQITPEVPLLPLNYGKSNERPFESFKWNNRNTSPTSRESKMVPIGPNKFVVPKHVPKQRTRTRSISSPQSNNLKHIPVTTAPSIDKPDAKVPIAPVERSNSLPVYNQRRNAIGPLLNAQLIQQQLQSTRDVAQQFPVHSMSFQPLVTEATPAINLQAPQTNVNTEANSLIVQLLASGGNNTRMKRSNNLNRDEVKDHQCNCSQQFESPINMKRKTTNTTSSVTLSQDSQINKCRHSNITQRPSLPFADSAPFTKTQTPSVSSPSFNAIPPVAIGSRESTNLPITPINTQPANSSSSVLKSMKARSDRDRIQYKEHRRVCHINAEQKRRCNIKNGFDTLRNILPSVNHNSNTKISKAAMLQRAADHIRSLKSERKQQQEEFDTLNRQIESLNATISVFQGQLPATGAPFSCQRTGQIKERFDAYVEERVLKNWKFWIFSVIMKPLLESYNNTVTTSNLDEMYQSVLRWVDQNCSLLTLRPNAIGALRHLSTSTNILTNPSSLPEEILESVARKAPNLQ